MTHKTATDVTFFRACVAGSLLLLLGACDGGGQTASDDETATAENDAASGATNAAGETATTAEAPITVHRDANGIATGEITVGDPDTPVEMIEYLSLTCPHCARHHIDIWPQIKKAYVDTGKIKLTFRIFARGPLDEIVSLVPLCAEEDRAYPIVDLMLSRQDRWLHGENGQEVLDNLAALVRRAGMSRATFDACVRNKAILQNVRSLKAVGVDQDRVTGTPTFKLDGETFNSVSFETFVERIEDAL